jgi:hypothetical protein
MVFFEDCATDKNIAKALLDAKRLRRALTEAHDNELMSKNSGQAPYVFGR